MRNELKTFSTFLPVLLIFIPLASATMQIWIKDPNGNVIVNGVNMVDCSLAGSTETCFYYYYTCDVPGYYQGRVYKDNAYSSWTNLWNCNPFDFSIFVSPTSGTVTQGSSIQTTVTATITSGETQPVSFSCSGLPTGASCSFSLPFCSGPPPEVEFSPTSDNPLCSYRLTISTGSTTPTGTYTITINGTGGGKTRTANYILTVLPAPPQFKEFDFGGTLEYFNIYWNVTGEEGQTLNTTCYLNCDPDIQDCSLAQTCSYTQLPGEGRCTILNPIYKSENNVTCIASYQAYPTIKTKITRYFKPIDFKAWVPEKITATVGTPTEVKINIRNTGLIPDSYNISLILTYPQYALISPSKVTTPVALKDETITTSPTLTLLLDQPNGLIINISSNSKPSVNQIIEIGIRSGSFALPEFHLLGLIQIMLLAAILILIKPLRGKNS